MEPQKQTQPEAKNTLQERYCETYRDTSLPADKVFAAHSDVNNEKAVSHITTFIP